MRTVTVDNDPRFRAAHRVDARSITVEDAVRWCGYTVP
eukprot:gene17100-19644_t